jgi:hypothetical protein
MRKSIELLKSKLNKNQLLNYNSLSNRVVVELSLQINKSNSFF